MLALEGGLGLWVSMARHRFQQVPAVAMADESVVFCVGDSVTAGVGVVDGQAWTDHLGLSLRRDGIPLVRVAHPGAGVEYALSEPLTQLMALPENVPPTVLVMLGHNDWVHWRPGIRRQFQALRNNPDSLQVGGEAQRWQGLRLLRMFRWGWMRWSGQGPMAEQASVSQLVERMVSAFAPLNDAATARQGQLVLLTYVVPGQPPVGMSEQTAETLRTVRGAQLHVNTAIRTAGEQLGAAVIDLALLVDVGEIWSLDAFTDHIHPTPRSNAQMGAVVYSHIRPPTDQRTQP